MTVYEDTQFRVTFATIKAKWRPIALLNVFAVGMLVLAGCTSASADIVEHIAQAERTVDLLAKKDVVWLALTAAIAASASSIVQTVLLFKLTFAGVKAIDRMAAKPCQMSQNPWGKE